MKYKFVNFYNKLLVSHYMTKCIKSKLFCALCLKSIVHTFVWEVNDYLFANYVHMQFVAVDPQEIEVRSVYHFYSLKTESSQNRKLTMCSCELSVLIYGPNSSSSCGRSDQQSP